MSGTTSEKLFVSVFGTTPDETYSENGKVGLISRGISRRLELPDELHTTFVQGGFFVDSHNIAIRSRLHCRFVTQFSGGSVTPSHKRPETSWPSVCHAA